MNCLECGKEIISLKKDIKYCSNSCRAKNLKQYKNFYVNGTPYNFKDSKIRSCLICGKKLHHCTKTGYCKEHYRIDTWKNKISSSLKGKTGGYNKGCGRGRKGLYKGYWCDSSWELAFVIYNLDHNIDFIRNTEYFNYSIENKIYKYYPDFKINNEYIEIKGYKTEIDDEKWKQFPHKLNVLYYSNIKHMLDYVRSIYGKDFTNLYARRAR